MKIGILTFHCAHNYGAVIQCYGLQQYLRSLGHQVFVIDYRPDYFSSYRLSKIKYSESKSIKVFIKRIINRIIIGKVKNRRYYAFDNFIQKKLNLIPFQLNSDYSEFDAIVLGSDQIWNPSITGGHYDEVFFGQNAKCKTISYAASSRTKTLSDEQKLYLKSHLCNIDSISVREESLEELLKPLVNQPISTVIDPSFLPEVDEYNNLCTAINSPRPYVLVYEVERNDDTSRIADEIAASIGADVIELVSHTSLKFCQKRFRQECGPIEFLSLIKNAKCIVTTSFHGMALSLKFQKHFYSIRQGTNADLRAESLLSRIGLLDRFIPLNSSVAFSEIDYSKCLPRLKEEICKSQAFLIKSLNK